MEEESQPVLISTTELCSRLGSTFSTQFLMALDLMPIKVTNVGTFWAEEDYEEICQALATYFGNGGAHYK